MSKEFIIENGIPRVRYSNQQECLADNSKETRDFLRSVKQKEAKVAGEFVILRRSKRGMKYVLIFCNEYNMEFEAGSAEEMKDLSLAEIRQYFNPEILEAKDMIENCLDRKALTLREIRKIFTKGISRARNIEYLDRFDMSKFYREILPELMKTNSCRTKVFITPNLRSKLGGYGQNSNKKNEG